MYKFQLLSHMMKLEYYSVMDIINNPKSMIIAFMTDYCIYDILLHL